MKTRRQVIKYILSFTIGISVFWGKFWTEIRVVYAKVKRVLLPKGTPMSDLISKNPKKLDAQNLGTTSMDQFDVMGQDIYNVNIAKWQLELTGAIKHPKKFSYENIVKLPVIERNVLLICRGFFAYNGLWKGFSVSELLLEAKMLSNVTHVKFSGPKGIRRKTKKFAIEEVMANKIFIAYKVNGEILPERHGFPVRLVAEDHYGSRWVKYVDKISVVAR